MIETAYPDMRQRKMARRRWQWLIQGVLMGLLLLDAPPGLGQTLRPEVRDPYLADPLLDQPRDPLLPDPPVARPLSPLERSALERELNQLDQQATDLLEAGNTGDAFDLWLREVRLRRLLGLEAELAALQRVGQRAWDEGQTLTIQLLTARLDAIRNGLLEESPLNLEYLEETAQTYEILGDPERAIALYQELADIALTAEDLTTYQAFLEATARVQRGWFYFTEATQTYEQLAQLATEPDQIVQFLEAAADQAIQAERYQQALDLQMRLLAQYQASTDWAERIPQLRLGIAETYLALGQPEEAGTTYQRAYQEAIVLQQFEQAISAIEGLVGIYRDRNRYEEVIYLYRQQLLVARQAYDAYRILETYDGLGQTYEALNQPQAALSAFREGLVMAEHLNHRVAYFIAQVDRLSDALGDPSVPASGATPNPWTDQ